ncbi:MAG TPA: CHAD domain-containing protein [Pyrinomonadaceae bacterium]|nr:CHAD domain-containing protein [Pyrinomonadaceae bacterium]
MAAPKRIKGIECNEAAGAGIRQALAERFDEMYALRRSALKWKDPEGVHSMRVASRRLRSAFGDFAPYLSKRRLLSPLKEIRTIADALGEVRDQDVALMALEEIAKEAPSEFSKTLGELVEARKKVRDGARAELEELLVKDRLKDLRTDFNNGLTLATDGATPPKSEAQISFADMARAIIHDRLRDLEKLSSSFYRPMEPAQLHEMRIAAKRLRYSIELFEACWGSKIARFAKQVARLQTALGTVHDCDVWIESFRKEVNEARRVKDAERISTFNWLFTHFNKLRHKHFTEAFSLWTTWEATDARGALLEALQK